MSTNLLSEEITQEKQEAVDQLLANLFSEPDFLKDLSAKGQQGPVKMGRSNVGLSVAVIVMTKAVHSLSRAL